MELFLYFIGLLGSICFVGFMGSMNTIQIMKLMRIDRKMNDLNHELVMKKLETIKNLEILNNAKENTK